MPEEVQYPWAHLLDMGKATSWCDRLPTDRLEVLPIQALLLTVSEVCEEGLCLARKEWHPETGRIPKPAQDAFLSVARNCHDVLLLCTASAYRQSPDCVPPPPSRPLSLATLATRLSRAQKGQDLPEDVASALLELEWVRQRVVSEHFSPLDRQHRMQRHLTLDAMEALIVGVGVVVACVESNKPWLSLG